MKKKPIIIFSFVIVLVISTNFSLFLRESTRNNNYNQTNNTIENETNLKVSDNGKPPLNYSAFYLNATSVYRVFQSIKFDINAASFPFSSYSLLNIDYYDNTNEKLLMEHVSSTDNFTYTYTPNYNTPLGFHNVSFLIYDVDDNLLSSDVPITNFTVRTNYIMTLNSSAYYKDDYVYGEVLVKDEPVPYTFNSNITVVDNDNETLENTIMFIDNDISQFIFKIDDRFECSNKQYYVKLNLSDVSNNIRYPAYLPFTAINSDPKINESTFIVSSTVLKRTEVCTLTFNASDVDFNTVPENLTGIITIKDSLGVSQSPISLTNNDDWSFNGTFSIAANKPIGKYELTIQIQDQYNGTDSYLTSITVENNPPKIHGYTINGFSMEEAIEIDYGDDIIFTFNVSDVEDSISYITVHLLNEAEEWYNITNTYAEDLELIIRTEELVTGAWLVYISVTDFEGDTTYLTSDYEIGPQEIRIIPDLLSPLLPWITLFIGVAIGVLTGLLIPYKRIKAKLEEPKQTLPKKPTNETKPKKKQKEVEEEELKPKGEISKETEEIDETKQIPQRRIKRKLK